MHHFVADLGNSRLKWARVAGDGRLVDRIALPLDPSAWTEAWEMSRFLAKEPSRWSISSVNPPVATQLVRFLEVKQVGSISWFLAASDVPVAKDVEGAETGGADRALAVLAAVRLMPPNRPGLVVSCGTAITLERITSEGVWEGGVIAPGLGVVASALHARTAQLPLLDTRQLDPLNPAPAWGRGTVSSLTAGVFWGTVGAIREILARQTPDINGAPWIIWTGGDAAILARFVEGDAARLEPDLVLVGLSLLPTPRG